MPYLPFIKTNFMRYIIPIFFLLIFSCKQETKKSVSDYKLGAILNNYSNGYYALNPLAATRNGVNTYNDQLDISIGQDHIQKMIAFNKNYLDTLSAIDTANLSYSEQLSIDILRFKLQMENEAFTNGYGLNRPVDQFVFSFPQNFATLGSGAGFIPFKTEADYRNFISRMKSFPAWIDQSIENMQAGLESHNTNPQASMLKVPAQLKPLFETGPDKNIFYKPLANLPAGMDTAAKAGLIKDYTDAIENNIKPAYKKLNDYLEKEYIPNTRINTGLIDNSNGAKEYAYWLKFYTTKNITADEIFALGESEVARIRKEMDSLKTLTGFKGDLKSFFQYIKTDKKFFPFKTEAEVLDRFKSFETFMEPQLKKMFNLRPKMAFEVRATEKFRAAGANAQYNVGSRDGIRPGIFYETVPDPLAYNYFSMESLYIHEAIPGHHFQSGLQVESDLPEFRKGYWTSAFGEGWALYAESLGKELGMYTDPYQYMGRLNNEIERAVRLVVDAGMHHKGWTREQAIAYVLDNQPVTEEVAIQRIERYMVTPGQAVSYKIGELSILAMRKKAQEKLGDKFDIKDFHDEMLREGCLPLVIMEKHMERWMNR
jgi:uncharacterized protein (DUF885 family)